MASTTDGLIDHLLLHVAFTHTRGLTALSFVDLVHDYHNTRTDVSQRNPNTTDHVDLFLSSEPPAEVQTVNSEYLERLWSTICEQADVSVKSEDASEHHESLPTDFPGESASFMSTRGKARLTTSEAKQWLAITGHAIDRRKVPQLEFNCLAVIAESTTKGIPQPQITALTGQDKRSVPKRTDGLKKKGYITKEPCLTNGAMTSLCRLARFSDTEDAQKGLMFQVRGEAAEAAEVMSYQGWWDAMINCLHENSDLVAMTDLRIHLEIEGKRLETRRFQRALRRIALTGMISRVTADDERATARNHHRVSCLKLNREPTTQDHELFTNSRAASKSLGHVDSDDDADADGDDDIDVVGDNTGMDSTRDHDGSISTASPIWNPGLYYSNFVYELIDASGDNGITSVELCQTGMGQIFRKPFDEGMAKLTDIWHLSQPPHLRHLAIVRDTKTYGSSIVYCYRTFDNFNRAARRGEASWEYQLTDEALVRSLQDKPNLDHWGFPLLPSKPFIRDGTIPISRCGQSILSSSISIFAKRGRPRKAEAARKRARRAQVSTDNVNPDPTLQELPDKLQSRTDLATPAVETPEIVRVSARAKPQGAETSSGFADKRVERERSEWLARCRRRAEARVRNGLVNELKCNLDATVHDGDDPKQPHVSEAAIFPEPSKNRKRKRKSSVSVQEPPPSVSVPQSRVDSIAEEIARQTEPGVYINPPGSIKLKMNEVLARGRPRNALIAVFKLDGLRALKWFVDDSMEDSTDEEHSPDPVTPRPIYSSKMDSQVQSVPVASTASVQKAANLDTEVEILPSTPALQESARKAMRSTTVPLPVSASAADQSVTDVALDSVEPLHRPEQEVSDSLFVPRASPSAESTAGQTSERDGVDNLASTLEPLTADVAVEKLSVDPVPKMMPKASRTSKSNPTLHPSYKPRWDKKVGLRASGGMATHRRELVVLDLVGKCSGMIPGDGEMYYSFITEMERLHQTTPDRTTLNRTVMALVAAGKLRRIAFTFKAKNGNDIQKHITMLTSVDPAAQAVQDLKQDIIATHPRFYLPTQAPLSAKYNLQSFGFAYAPIGVTRAPRDDMAPVRRLYSSDSREPDAFERRLEKEMRAREAKRQKEQLAKQRYEDALEEEDVAAAALDLQTQSLRRIKQAQAGRFGAPARLHFGAARLQPATRKPLGSLRSMRERDAARLPRPESLPQLLQQTPESYRRRLLVESKDSPIVRFDHEIRLVAAWEELQQDQHRSRGSLPFAFINHSAPQDFEPVSFPHIKWHRSGRSMSQAIHARPLMAHNSRQGAAPTASSRPRGRPQTDTFEVARAQFAPMKCTGPRQQFERRIVAVEASSTESCSLDKGLHASKMPARDINRLILGLAVVLTLSGGLGHGARSINWIFIAQVFHYRYPYKELRAHWITLKYRKTPKLEEMVARFRECFLIALQDGDICDLELDHPQLIDWAELVDWAKTRLARKEEAIALADLPRTAETFRSKFRVEEQSTAGQVDTDEYYNPLTTMLRRDALADAHTYTVPFRPRPEDQARKSTMLAKSYIRATVCTPEQVFDEVSANDKLTRFDDGLLTRASEELVNARVIRQKFKGRTKPGRNYVLNEGMNIALKRPWNDSLFIEAARHKLELDERFKGSPSVELSFHALDAHYLVDINLVIDGQVVVEARIPPIDHTFRFKGAHLSKWGFTDGNYKTVHMDRGRLHMALDIVAADKYTSGSLLSTGNVVDPAIDAGVNVDGGLESHIEHNDDAHGDNNVAPLAAMPHPPLTKHFPDEPYPRLPFWTNIDGSLIPWAWKQVLVSILYLLSIRPGMTVTDMEFAHKSRLWSWEIEMVLKWAETSGIARRIDAIADREGSNDAESVSVDQGWTTGGAWWMAFARAVPAAAVR